MNSSSSPDQDKGETKSLLHNKVPPIPSIFGSGSESAFTSYKKPQLTRTRVGLRPSSA